MQPSHFCYKDMHMGILLHDFATPPPIKTFFGDVPSIQRSCYNYKYVPLEALREMNDKQIVSLIRGMILNLDRFKQDIENKTPAKI